VDKIAKQFFRQGLDTGILESSQTESHIENAVENR
jgi:hypothetical protein